MFLTQEFLLGIQILMCNFDSAAPGRGPEWSTFPSTHSSPAPPPRPSHRGIRLGRSTWLHKTQWESESYGLCGNQSPLKSNEAWAVLPLTLELPTSFWEAPGSPKPKQHFRKEIEIGTMVTWVKASDQTLLLHLPLDFSAMGPNKFILWFVSLNQVLYRL